MHGRRQDSTENREARLGNEDEKGLGQWPARAHCRSYEGREQEIASTFHCIIMVKQQVELVLILKITHHGLPVLTVCVALTVGNGDEKKKLLKKDEANIGVSCST